MAVEIFSNRSKVYYCSVWHRLGYECAVGAQSSVLRVVFAGVDVVVVVVSGRVISMAARRYRTSQNYKKRSVDRVRQGLGCEGIGGLIKRAMLRFFWY